MNNATVTWYDFSGPEHGRLVLKGQEDSSVQEFSVSELSEGLLKYHHDDTSTRHDHILLQTTDGFNALNFILDVEITPQVCRKWSWN